VYNISTNAALSLVTSGVVRKDKYHQGYCSKVQGGAYAIPWDLIYFTSLHLILYLLKQKL